MDECKPLFVGLRRFRPCRPGAECRILRICPRRRRRRNAGCGIFSVRPLSRRTRGRGLHSSTFRLNVSALCGVGGAIRDCLGGVEEVSGG